MLLNEEWIQDNEWVYCLIRINFINFLLNYIYSKDIKWGDVRLESNPAWAIANKIKITESDWLLLHSYRRSVRSDDVHRSMCALEQRYLFNYVANF